MITHHRRRPRRLRGGLAGRLAGVPVTLYEMRPVAPTAVHKTDRLAELVCSNSFRGDKLDNAVGLLKEEMRRLGLARHARGRSEPRAGRRRAGGRPRAVRRDRHRAPRRPSAITIVREEVHDRFPTSTERAPGDRRDRAADLARRCPPTSRVSSAAITCTSTTRSARSCWPRRSIGRRSSGSRAGIAASGRAGWQPRHCVRLGRARLRARRRDAGRLASGDRRAASTMGRATI